MKKFSKLGILLGVLLFTLLISGCGKKTALTASEFKSKMEDLGFEIVDVTEYISDEAVKTVYNAQKVDAYTIEFYVSKTDSGATAGYNQFVANLKAISAKTGTEITKDTYSKYTDTASGYYSVVSKIDKTYLNVRAKDSYKTEINEIIEELGY